MADRRRKDANWIVGDDTGKVQSWDEVQVAILMDIRDELKRLNAVLHCPNFLDIPRKLDKVERNTKKKRRRRVVGKPALRVVRS